jgi:hypothetical protein
MKTVEEPLNTLGTIFIVVGVITGILATVLSIIEKDFFYFVVGLSSLFGGLCSGYLFKGISNIIDLLFSLNRTLKNQSYSPAVQNNTFSKEVPLNNKEQSESKKNISSSPNKKSYIENLEDAPSKHTSRNEIKNPAESKNRSWSEISDSMKKK